MLAFPLYPTTSFSPRKPSDESPQYRPAKDMEAFNSLLPPAIEFVEGSSSGTLILGEGKYEPINASPTKVEPLPSPSTKTHRNSVSAPTSNIASLYTGTIDTTWPNPTHVGCGFNNIGNTCFLNSALQCLIYTPPLVRMLSLHHQPCKVKNPFCMACALRQTMIESRNKTHSFTPYLITTKMQVIAKHMRRGRQEDSHEFLRYAIDALQRSCLASYPPKMDPKLAETTWVHKVFGGRLRSRVTCQECGFHSDTFDSILDLSIDICTVYSVRDALRKFVAVDHLRGANKYKCEKCKKSVAAEKQFTIHEAPAVLTIHLKRFSPMGRKIGHAVKYDVKLPLQPYMSDSQFGPTYSLYAVISHAGSGPNSGHYYAHVKDGIGNWHEMNDESVTRHHGIPLSMKNAYILFYVRDKGQALESAIALEARPLQERVVQKNSIVGNMKKRKIVESEDDNEDTGVATTPLSKAPFIGPRLPSPLQTTSPTSDSNKKPKLDSRDPQAERLKERIQAATTGGSALQSLSQYGEDDEDGERDDSEEEAEKEKAKEKLPVSLANSIATIPPHIFYGSTLRTNASPEQKRKPLNGDRNRENGAGFDSLTFSSSRSPGNSRRRKQLGSGLNPYSRVKGSNNLARRENISAHYGKKRRNII